MPTKRSRKSRVSVLISDQESIFRLGLKKLFSVEDDLRVVAQAENEAQFVSMAKSFRPQVALVQADILGNNPQGVLGTVHRLIPHTKFIVVIPALADNEVDRFVRAGAAGVILRASSPEIFVKSLRKVAAGETWILDRGLKSNEASATGIGSAAIRPVDTLTRREKTIISGLTRGWRNREIADCLSISEQTVKNHLRSIYDKVGVSDRLELVLYAIHQKLELPPLPGTQAA